MLRKNNRNASNIFSDIRYMGSIDECFDILIINSVF
jgi:hypothetical protein